MCQIITHLILTLTITSGEFSQAPTWRDLPLQNVDQLPPTPVAIDHFHVAPDACLALTLPMPLSRTDVGIMIESLSLAPPQVLYLDHFMSSYAQCIEAIRRDSIALVQVSGMQAASAQRQRNYPVFAIEFEQFTAGEQRIRVAVLQCEQMLLHSLSEILADPQREPMERWKAMRTRERLPTDFIETPSAKVDLSKAVSGIAAFSPVVDLICAEYERVVTPVMQRLTDEVFRRRPQVAHDRATLVLTGDPAIDELRVHSHLQACARIRSAWAALERRIRDINLTYMLRLADALPTDARDEFRRACLEQFYPAIYPDIGATSLLDAALKDLPAQLLEAVRTVIAGYEVGYTKICADLERNEDTWFEQLALTASHKNGLTHETRLKALLADRASLNLRTIESLQAIVSAEESPTLQVLMQHLAQMNRRVLSLQ